ncbi:succinylglutamate desuccinylase/aspartoacylase family protein [Amaricoccus solimangrovi]|uniref:Peptidase M14 n=1 Tax=Amaricoccus solimangrovi TaxID=2589815 RepID=A0A501WRX5_9RHOB|nr:succinylglutamate desuccinylase/aspartoacylase family protein [Amaricoccus solimangrovi]TPE52118.1 peptidase M14 [Amaricoccus solimangrovi]
MTGEATSEPGRGGRREVIALPPVAPGTRRELTVLRFGTPGARPKAYLQAGLHADELPGMLILSILADLLAGAEARGEIRGEIVLVPVANPIGLAQHRAGFLLGRYDNSSTGNYNRDYLDLARMIEPRLAGRLGADAAANVAIIRAAMAEALAGEEPLTEVAALRHALLTLSHDADFMLDLHADNAAEVHLYTGTPLWPDAADLAAGIGARAVLLAELSGGNPFDEAVGGPWWSLARAYPDAAIPPACLSATLEMRSNDAVDGDLAQGDALALLDFLRRRGLVSGAAAELPRSLCDATPLEAMQQVTATAAGIVVYKAALGAMVADGDLIAEIVDPLGLTPPAEIRARTAGVLFARHSQPYAWSGKIIAKIAGAEPLPERTGKLLPG